MTTAIVVHRVADYGTWRPVYDAFDETRREMGVTHHEVLRSQEDPNEIIVRHDFPDRATADAFLGSSELKKAMTDAGVDESSVQIHVAEPA